MSVFNPSKRVVLRAASGALTAGETTTPVFNMNEYRFVAVILDVTTITASAGEEIDFYLQTTYFNGTSVNDWFDLENIHLDNGDNGSTVKKVLIVTPNRPTAGDVAEDVTVGTLSDNSKIDLPLDAGLRIVTKVTNTPTYAYSATAYLT